MTPKHLLQTTKQPWPAALLLPLLLAGCGGSTSISAPAAQPTAFTIPTPNSLSAVTANAASVKFYDGIQVMDPISATDAPQSPAYFVVTLTAPASSSIPVLAVNEGLEAPRLVGTLTFTDASGKTIYTAPLSTGTAGLQTLKPGQEADGGAEILPSQLPLTGDYKVTAAVQTPGAASPITVGPLVLHAQ